MSGWPRKLIPKKSKISRSWKSAVGKSSTQESISAISRRPGSGSIALTRMRSRALAVDQLVVDAEARVGRQVVGGVDARAEVVGLAGLVAQPGEDREDLLGVDDQGGLLVVEAGVDDRAGVALVDLRADQLETGGVRHSAPPRVPTS